MARCGVVRVATPAAAAAQLPQPPGRQAGRLGTGRWQVQRTGQVAALFHLAESVACYHKPVQELRELIGSTVAGTTLPRILLHACVPAVAVVEWARAGGRGGEASSCEASARRACALAQPWSAAEPPDGWPACGRGGLLLCARLWRALPPSSRKGPAISPAIREGVLTHEALHKQVHGFQHVFRGAVSQGHQLFRRQALEVV